ncbi:MAG TPA: ABC transporter ATP-binding protein [Gemmatimonadales bacterium]|nr:ABC transporter ATP-binding protein [Gemmatimonadales bacterium]
MRDEKYLSVAGLTKSFGGVAAVDALSLGVARGEILALLGPSGSGKTTTLRLLAGFEVPDAGTITVDGEDVTRTAPAARRFGMVFQHYALFPHLDVGQNVSFGLAASGEAAARRVREVLAMVDLAGYERRPVTALSGGQQQRVAVARSLAPEPRVLLLDEPLSNLDPSLRERTRRELRRAIKQVGITTVFVTHEQEEAFELGDRIAVLSAGHLEQVGTADELYDEPRTAFVAGFVGRAAALPGERVAGAVRAGARALVRPEAMRFVPLAGAALQGVVTERRFVGAQAYFTVDAGAGAVFDVQAPHGAVRVGERVGVAVDRVLFWDRTDAPTHGRTE